MDQQASVMGDAPLVPITAPEANASVVSGPAALFPVDPGVPTAGSDARPKHDNYFARHWRGDLSLGVSYWINYCLGNFGAAILFAGVRWALEPADNPFGW